MYADILIPPPTPDRTELTLMRDPGMPSQAWGAVWFTFAFMAREFQPSPVNVFNILTLVLF